jgi:hypothetical protein
MGIVISDDIINGLNNAMPENQIRGLGTLIDQAFANVFSITASITAAAAGTAVTILPDSFVPAGKKVYISNIFLIVSAGTAWADVTATKLTIQDSAAVAGVAYAKAGLTGNAIINTIGGTNQTLSDPISTGVGFTAGKGLQIVGDANFGAGSTIYVTVSGVVK